MGKIAESPWVVHDICRHKQDLLESGEKGKGWKTGDIVGTGKVLLALLSEFWGLLL